jgi:hypothetical protein
LSGRGEHHKEELLRGAEYVGEALSLLTWVIGTCRSTPS